MNTGGPPNDDRSSGLVRRYSRSLIASLPFSLIGVVLIIRGVEAIAENRVAGGALQLAAGIGIVILLLIALLTYKTWSKQ